MSPGPGTERAPCGAHLMEPSGVPGLLDWQDCMGGPRGLGTREGEASYQLL